MVDPPLRLQGVGGWAVHAGGVLAVSSAVEVECPFTEAARWPLRGSVDIGLERLAAAVDQPMLMVADDVSGTRRLIATWVLR